MSIENKIQTGIAVIIAPQEVPNGNPLRALIVEDSEDDTLMVVRVLKKGGYDLSYERVETADTTGEALVEKQGHYSSEEEKIWKLSGM